MQLYNVAAHTEREIGLPKVVHESTRLARGDVARVFDQRVEQVISS